MKKLKLLAIIFFTLFLISCYAKELILVDPVFNVQSYGIKKILFLGFENHHKLEAPTKIKMRLENSLFEKFQKLNLVNIEKIDKDEAILYPTYTPKDFITLSKKYNTNVIVIGYIDEYKEYKYVDQPLTKYTQNSNNLGFADPNLKNLVRYDIYLSGKLDIINSNGDVLWSHKINDVKSVQFEIMPNDLSKKENELNVYAQVRESVIESISDDVIKDLIPYYLYKY